VAMALIVVGSVTVAVLRAGSDVLDEGLRRKPSGRLLGTLVEAYVSTLRRKLEQHGPRVIHTVRGVGYRIGDTTAGAATG